MKVLIIEDEEVLAKVFAEKLAQVHFETLIAADGEEGLKLARSKNPDVIILDLLLPKKDGFEVLKEVKASPELAQIPVVVVSNLGEDEDIKRAFSLGADDYFVKVQHPINEIVEKVKAVGIKSK